MNTGHMTHDAGRETPASQTQKLSQTRERTSSFPDMFVYVWVCGRLVLLLL